MGWDVAERALRAEGVDTSSWRVLKRDYYDRNTVKVSKDLLGKIVVVMSGKKVTAGRIVETEAYRSDDPACHAARGMTPRNEILFGDPGHVYVYFIYGMYEMLNFVAEERGKPGAILIRGLEPMAGIAAMRARRPHVVAERDLLNGPGRLARAMGVTLRHKGDTLWGPNFFVVDDGYFVPSISVSSRVGISDGEDLLWRFVITGNACVSKAPQNKQLRILRKSGADRDRGRG